MATKYWYLLLKSVKKLLRLTFFGVLPGLFASMILKTIYDLMSTPEVSISATRIILNEYFSNPKHYCVAIIVNLGIYLFLIELRYSGAFIKIRDCIFRLQPKKIQGSAWEFVTNNAGNIEKVFQGVIAQKVDLLWEYDTWGLNLCTNAEPEDKVLCQQRLEQQRRDRVTTFCADLITSMGTKFYATEIRKPSTLTDDQDFRERFLEKLKYWTKSRRLLILPFSDLESEIEINGLFEEFINWNVNGYIPNADIKMSKLKCSVIQKLNCESVCRLRIVCCSERNRVKELLRQKCNDTSIGDYIDCAIYGKPSYVFAQSDRFVLLRDVEVKNPTTSRCVTAYHEWYKTLWGKDDHSGNEPMKIREDIFVSADIKTYDDAKSFFENIKLNFQNLNSGVKK